MDKRDHAAECSMDDEGRALALALLEDRVPVIIHAGRETRARAIMASVEECDCGKPEQHFYLRVHAENGDHAHTAGPLNESELRAMLPTVPYLVDYVDRFILAATLN